VIISHHAEEHSVPFMQLQWRYHRS